MLNHVLATLNDYVLAYNQDENKYSFISNNIAELAGYSAEEFEKDQQLWQSLIDPRDADKVKKQSPITENDLAEYTYRIRTRSGRTRWVYEKLSLFNNERSEGNIAVSIIKDIQREDEAKYNQEEAMAGYGILFDNNPNPMLIYELATLRILKVNASAIETYGYPREEFLTMTMRDLRPNIDSMDEDGNSGLFRGFNKLRKHFTKSGESVYVEINSDSINYKNRDCRMVIANNVTDKIRWREEVKLREQFLNSLIDSQTNFLIRIDINGCFTFINKQFSKVFEYQKYELIGHHFAMTVLPEEMYLCEAAFIECTTNPGKVTHLIHKKPSKTGKIYDTEWEFIAIRNEEGQVTGVQGMGRDITDKVNNEKEIALTKSNLEALINNTDHLIWSVDRDYRYLYMNQAYKKAITNSTGIIPHKGESALHDVPEDILSLSIESYDRCINGDRYTMQLERASANGDTNYYEISFNPISNVNGEITGVGCFLRNITDLVRTTKVITEKNERLQNIASLSSHELRRPVATMLGLINILDKENFFNPDNLQIIEHILTVGVEIDEVIKLIVDHTFTAQGDM